MARRRGIPVLAFRKQGIETEPRQEQFIKAVEEYTGGRFRDSFDGPSDLQTKVVAALRKLEESSKPLTWTPLDQQTEVPWLYALEERRSYAGHATTLECHVVPVEFRGRIQATALEALPRRLAALGRDYDLFGPEEALDLSTEPDEARAVRAGRHADPATGIRVQRNGVVTVWRELPGDGLGSILDPADVQARLTRSLRLASNLLPTEVNQVTLAVGLAPISFVVEGSLADLGRRSSASIGMPSQDWARVEPEDSLPASVIGTAAEEIAAELTARLLQQFRAIRR